jgi:hypothetical protein
VTRVRLIFEPRDLWVGVYAGPHAVFIALIPCLVLRWDRATTETEIIP